MSGALLAAAIVFRIEKSNCVDPFVEVAALYEHRTEDPDRYQDNWIDYAIEPSTHYCYRMLGGCNLGAGTDNPVQMFLWWTRHPPAITGVRFTNKTTLAWDSYDRGENGELPATITYEVLQGTLGTWGEGMLTVGLPWSQANRTVSGTSEWFMVRVANACGVGPW